jgi:hypothetical protein
MPAQGLNGSQLPFVNPLFDGCKANAEDSCSFTRWAQFRFRHVRRVDAGDTTNVFRPTSTDQATQLVMDSCNQKAYPLPHDTISAESS